MGLFWSEQILKKKGSELDTTIGKKGLKFIHINTRSVFHKLDELKHNFSNFDVIVFTETWLNNSIDDSQIGWDGFQLVCCDRKVLRNKRGGGVCMYIRSLIAFEKRSRLL